MGVVPDNGSLQQLNHDVSYNKHSQHYPREVSTDPPDEATEYLNDLETTTEYLNYLETTTEYSNDLRTTTEYSNDLRTTTEYLNDLETTTLLTEETSIKDISVADNMWTPATDMLDETTDSTLDFTTMRDGFESDSSSESSQTVLIILGTLLAILIIVCCVLACIFAKIRRKGFCTVDGKNQATCDDDCQEDAINLQQSPKESTSSRKLEASRSSDKLLTK